MEPKSLLSYSLQSITETYPQPFERGSLPQTQVP
jgi:hypothetical protein